MCYSVVYVHNVKVSVFFFNSERCCFVIDSCERPKISDNIIILRVGAEKGDRVREIVVKFLLIYFGKGEVIFIPWKLLDDLS